jgi:Zn finger protein HypA/HybF involved in hydrogenase expression
MRLRQVPLEKKQMSCLRCGTMTLTDAAHRICRKCHRHNAEIYDAPMYCSSGIQGSVAV